ncbi:MAG: hypothetical protein HY897_24635 [Deltaproteobacteria bacterium]|nr:hypothetical protein [Deltaproteobacteria bacterium]
MDSRGVGYWSLRIVLFSFFSLLTVPSPPARAAGEEFTVPKEEPNTVFTRRWNWAHPRPEYYSTTRHGDSGEPRLDETRDPDQSAPYLYMGSATAVFNNLPPGKYELWVFYRKSTNRSRNVPWKVTTDAATNNTAGGIIDQYEDVACCGEWYLIPETRSNPIGVQSSFTLKWSADKGDFPEYDGRSVAYGGARVRRVSDDPTPLDGGVADTGGPAGTCAAIRSTPGFELCVETETTCAGVFTNGAGCAAYCATANMVCTEAFGASPGCNKELENPLECAATEGHNSDWCECAYPPGYDGGTKDGGTTDEGTPDAPDASDMSDTSDPPDAFDAGTFDVTGLSDLSSAPDAAASDRSEPSDLSDLSDAARQPPDAGAAGGDAGAEPFEYDALGCGCVTVRMN